MQDLLIEFADELDRAGFYSEADGIDQTLRKIAAEPTQPGDLRKIKKSLERVFQVIRNIPDDASRVPGDMVRRSVQLLFKLLDQLVAEINKSNPAGAQALKKVDRVLDTGPSL